MLNLKHSEGNAEGSCEYSLEQIFKACIGGGDNTAGGEMVGAQPKHVEEDISMEKDGRAIGDGLHIGEWIKYGFDSESHIFDYQRIEVHIWKGTKLITLLFLYLSR